MHSTEGRRFHDDSNLLIIFSTIVENIAAVGDSLNLDIKLLPLSQAAASLGSMGTLPRKSVKREKSAIIFQIRVCLMRT